MRLSLVQRMSFRQLLIPPLVIIFFIYFFSAAAYAQQENFSFEHFTENNGLSAPVTNITQDKYGFLWFGTTDGLNRFDGKNFVVYRNIPGDTMSLANNIINHLAVDSAGRIWAATNGGLCYYDFADDAFHKIRMNDTLEKIDRHRVHAVSISKSSEIWFATKTFIHLLKNNGKVKSWSLPVEENLSIDYLYANNENQIWVGTNTSRIYLFNPQTEKLIYAKISSPFSTAINFQVNIHPIIPYSKDSLLIGSWYGGLQIVVYNGNFIKTLPVPDNFETDERKNIVNSIAKSAEGKWWIGTYGSGITFFDGANHQLSRHIRHDPSDSKSISSDYINDIFTDNAGITWIGTLKGLDKFDVLAQQFQTVPIPEFKGVFSVYRSPSSFVEDNNDPEHQWMWMTVSGFGLVHFNKVTNEFRLYSHEEGNPRSLPDNRVRTLYYDNKGRLWIGMRTGVCIFDESNKKFLIPSFFQNLELKNINKIFQDSRSRYWFTSSSHGVYCYDEPLKKMTSWKYVEGNPRSLPDDHVFCILEDHEGKIWIGTQNNGLCRLDPQTDKFIYFMNDRKNPASLPDNGIYDLYEDNNRHLWIATENGFADMDLADHSMKIYTTKNGLSNNDVFSITKDNRNHLWLATNNGISDFDPVNLTFKNYFTSSGLPANRVDGAAYFGSDGTLYFGSRGDIISCHPQNMKLNTRIPPVIITGFRIFDKPVAVMRKEGRLLPIHLSYRQNMITVDFAALNFSNPGLNRYAYKLEGFDNSWIDCGNKQSATYTNLDGGTYTFRVKAANNDGVWNEEGAYVQLTVAPPFWKTWWFYFLCLAAIAAVFYFIYRIRISQFIKLHQVRTRIARDLHDDVGSTLSSINMISSMADNNAAQKKHSELFKTISSASGEAMELMNDIVWSVNPKNDRMEMIMTRMRQYASEMLEAANISFTLDMDKNCKHIILPIEKRKDFYLIFKEAINNLAKYSEAKSANIQIRYRNKILFLVVSDNGIGFNSGLTGNAAVKGGNGLKNMQARAAQLKGEINVTSESGKGTTVTLKIPVSP